MDKIAAGIIDKLSIVGFFNVIISGAVILHGLSPVMDRYAPQLFYAKLGLDNDLEKGIIICLMCYILGCALQGIQENLFSGLKKSVVSNCMVGIKKTPRGAKGKSILGNPFKERGIIKLASDLYSQKNLGEFDPSDKEMCAYFIDYCEYSNSIKGYGSKASKNSESATFYEMLAVAFYTLVVIGIFVVVFVHTGEWGYCIFYLVMGAIFTGRAYQHHTKWVKAVLATYEAVVDKEKSDVEQLNKLLMSRENIQS